MASEELAVGGIVVGDRIRKESRHLGALVESIRRVGLLHPVVVNTRGELVAGGRRLEAVKQLGWATVPVRRVATLDDALAALLAERDENTCREPLAPSEMLELGRKIEALEKPAAKERQAATQSKPGSKVGVEGGGKFPPPSTGVGKTRDKVGSALGVSGKTYEKAKQVAAAAKADPAKFGDLPAKMDAESVDAAHKEMRKRQGKGKKGKDKPATAHAGGAGPDPETRPGAADTGEQPGDGGAGPVGGNDDDEKPGGAAVVMPTPVDAWGIPVQPHAAEAFAAVPRFKELVAAVAHAQKLFNEVANLPGGVFLTLPDVSSYRRGKRLDDGSHADRFVHEGLERALHQIKNAVPTHTVCPWYYAEAPHPAKCSTCLDLNWTPVLGANIPGVCVDRAKEAHHVEA